MTILRSTLYTDKILAVLREYSANAWDAHRVIGKADVPIKVTLPTELNPNLVIRDYGPGISPDNIFRIYTQYGASTKREDDLAVGMLGIGSKSGFAYSDTFTVTSYFDGQRCMYLAVLDKTNAGLMTLLDSGPCGTETGVEVQIPVKTKDIEEFVNKAKSLFKFFSPRPDINIELEEDQIVDKRLTRAAIAIRPGSWEAVMGCIPYRINTAQLDKEKLGEKIFAFLSQISGTLYFDIGEIEVNASREELNYSDETKATLEARFMELVDEWMQIILTEINSSEVSNLAKRAKLQFLNRLGNIPKTYQALSADTVKLPPSDLFSFHFVSSTWKKSVGRTKELSAAQTSIRLKPNTRLILKDDNRILRGFEFEPDFDYVVKSIAKPPKPLGLLRVELDAYLKEMLIDGITIQKLSELPFSPQYSYRSTRKNDKHHNNVFVLEPTQHGAGSENWSIVPGREPEGSDVFVLLSRFEAIGVPQISLHVKTMIRVAEMFGKEKIPNIYGYKTTDRDPVDEKSIIGTHFSEWSTKWWEELNSKAMPTELVEAGRASGILKGGQTLWRHFAGADDGLKKLQESLGKDHPIVTLFTDHGKSEDILEKFQEDHPNGPSFYELSKNITIIDKIEEESRDGFEKRIQHILDTYPILSLRHLSVSRVLEPGETDSWVEYITAVDTVKGKKTCQQPQSTP